MKKVILTKTTNKPVACALRITSPDNSKSKLAYAELFRAVLQIPEQDVQQRILDAVNGKSSRAQIVHAICPNCKRTFDSSAGADTRKTVETQTDLNEIVSHVNNQPFRIIALPLDRTPKNDANFSTNSEIGQPFKKPERSFVKQVDTSFPIETLSELMDKKRIEAGTKDSFKTSGKLEVVDGIAADITSPHKTLGEAMERIRIAADITSPTKGFDGVTERNIMQRKVLAKTVDGPLRLLKEILEPGRKFEEKGQSNIKPEKGKRLHIISDRIQPEMMVPVYVGLSSPLQKPAVFEEFKEEHKKQAAERPSVQPESINPMGSSKLVNENKILTSEKDDSRERQVTTLMRQQIKSEKELQIDDRPLTLFQKPLPLTKPIKEVKRISIQPEMADPITVERHSLPFQKPLAMAKLIKGAITQPQKLIVGKFITQGSPPEKSLRLQPEIGDFNRDQQIAERPRIGADIVQQMDCGEQPIKRVSLKIVNGYKISTNEPPTLLVERPRIQAEMALEQPIKRRRKRKLCLPQVVKRSQAQMAQTQMQPKLRKEKVVEVIEFQSMSSDMEWRTQGLDDCSAIKKPERRDSFGSIPSDVLMEELFKEPYEHKSKEEHIMRVMAEECLEAEKRTDGLLAIHRTIVMNDLYALRRQIFVWKKLRKLLDLNDLLTDEDETCLQLAIKQDCYPKLIQILLHEGLNANEVDYHSNTCLHLAILNEIELESIRLLMQKIDLKLLLQLNDDGYTPLHIAVRTDNYLRAEVILNTLDERLQTSSLFERNARYSSTRTKEEFNKCYEDICKMLEKRYVDITKNAQPKLKKRFLEAGDRKSGNTALFFAVENKLEHFIFFLLAHLTDPRITNFSGQDAKSYYSEFGKSLNLSLKVDNAMESVIAFLDK